MDNLLFIDTETGGLNPVKHSLLSIAFITWNGQELKKDSFYVKQKKYFITKEAYQINKININLIKDCSVEKNEIIKYLREIKHCFFSDGKITLAGQNVNFDYKFLKRLYEEENEDFTQDFSYRVLDVSSILKFLYIAKKLPKDISALDDAIQYFDIPITVRHTAMADCEATLKVFEEILKLV